MLVNVKSRLQAHRSGFPITQKAWHSFSLDEDSFLRISYSGRNIFPYGAPDKNRRLLAGKRSVRITDFFAYGINK
jgi:hypothetical protein